MSSPHQHHEQLEEHEFSHPLTRPAFIGRVVTFANSGGIDRLLEMATVSPSWHDTIANHMPETWKKITDQRPTAAIARLIKACASSVLWAIRLFASISPVDEHSVVLALCRCRTEEDVEALTNTVKPRFGNILHSTSSFMPRMFEKIVAVIPPRERDAIAGITQCCQTSMPAARYLLRQIRISGQTDVASVGSWASSMTADGNVEILSFLLRNWSLPQQVLNALLLKAESVECLRCLLSHGADANATTRPPGQVRSLLHQFIVSERFDLAAQLIEFGAGLPMSSKGLSETSLQTALDTWREKFNR